MKRNALAALTAAVLLCSSVQMPEAFIHAADSYDVDVHVTLDCYRQPISPYLYGVNSDFRKEEYLYDATATSARQGGNRFSGYNWEINFSNAGRDYYHYSDEYLVDFDKSQLAIPGAPALGFAREAAEKNVPYKITTIQMAGYVAADGDGEVTEDQIAPSDRWVEVRPAKGSAFSLTPDTTDGYVYMDEYVNYLVQNLGDATTATGYQAYNLDNEPALWASTHARMHPDPVTCEEIVTKSVDYASAIKAVDPNAEIFGLALFGLGAYTNFASAPDWSEHADEYNWFISYYLDEMRKAEEACGKRLIDVVDVHYYSEAKGQCRVTECEDYTHTDCIDARLQSTRTLWDPMYIENSWVGTSLQKYLPVLTNVNKSIDTYYPGTKLALTEYNFGGGNHISGAIVQADALGVFAKQGVYVANLWNVCSSMEYHLSAIDLYTNYDGNGASFGDTLVDATTSDPEKATAYASIDGADENRVTMVLTNKSRTEAQNATITLDSDVDYNSAKVYGITGDSPEIRLLDTVDSIDGNTFTLELPALTVVQIEINSEETAVPGDVNLDGAVDDLDIHDLNAALLAKQDTVISWDNADVDADGTVNAFDLAALKKKLVFWRTDPETEEIVAFWWTKVGQYRIKNGMGGQTVYCTFIGEPGYQLNLGFGYWDPNYVNPDTGATGKWINNDTTALGKHTFDETGRAVVPIAIPEDAMSVEIMLFNYTTTDASGTVVQLDKDLVTLEKVITE